MSVSVSTQEIGRPATVVRRGSADDFAKPKKGTRSFANIEIGPAEKPTRRQVTSADARSKSPASSVAKTPASSNAKPVRRRAITFAMTSGDASSADSMPSDGQPMPATATTQSAIGAQASANISDIVSDIVRNQRLRKFAIKSQSRCDRSIESLIASMIGYDPEADEKSRKAVFAKARSFRVAVESGKGQSCIDTQGGSALSALIPAIRASAIARQPWDDLRAEAERQMEALAQLLPVWQFVKGVRGLGAKGLAVIVAEAGIPIGDYRTVSGLWKRLGLAVIGGRAQRKVAGEGAAEQGYSPGRRSQIWAFCSDTMFRAQWRGADEAAGLPARPIGPYGAVYAKRREATATRDPEEWTKARCHNDARRVMTKALMLDLWLVWRGLSPAHHD